MCKNENVCLRDNYHSHQSVLSTHILQHFSSTESKQTPSDRQITNHCQSFHFTEHFEKKILSKYSLLCHELF